MAMKQNKNAGTFSGSKRIVDNAGSDNSKGVARQNSIPSGNNMRIKARNNSG